MLTPLPAAPPLVGGLGVPVVMATPIAVEKDEADVKKKEGVGWGRGERRGRERLLPSFL